MQTQSSRFDRLVDRHYPAVYGLATRLTDDPRDAIALTRSAFESVRIQVAQLRNRTSIASELISAVMLSGSVCSGGCRRTWILLRYRPAVGDRRSRGRSNVLVTARWMTCLKMAIRFVSRFVIRWCPQSRGWGFYLRVVKEGELGACDSVK